MMSSKEKISQLLWKAKYMDKKKRVIPILIIIIAVIPLLLVMMPGVRDWLSSNDRKTILELIISYISFLATVGIGVIIYRFQRNDSNSEKQSRIQAAKLLMYNELEKAICLYILNSDRYVSSNLAHLTETFQRNAVELHEGLSQAQYSHLNLTVDYIDSYIASVEEVGRIEAANNILHLFRKWIQCFIKSPFFENLCHAASYKDLLDEKTFDLLNALSGSNEKYHVDLYDIKDADGRLLFRHKNAQHTIVLEEGEIVFDGWYSLDEETEEIKENGYWKNLEYEGYYVDGVRSGQGKTFNLEGRVTSEGIWEDGVLVQGIEYDWVIKVSDDETEAFFQLYSNFHYSEEERFQEMLEGCKTFEGCYIADGKDSGEKIEFINLKPFEDYVKGLPETEDFYTYLIEE